MLIPCPECKQQISEDAPSCPKCGRPITDEEAREAVAAKQEEAREAVAAKQKDLRVTGYAIVAVVVIFLLVLVFASRPPSPDEDVPRLSTPTRGPKIEAWVMAQQFVKGQLRAPSTASFGSVFGDYQDPDEHVTALGDGRYQVVGWVDAENAFGAKVRSDFLCILRELSNEEWRCEQVSVTGR